MHSEVNVNALSLTRVEAPSKQATNHERGGGSCLLETHSVVTCRNRSKNGPGRQYHEIVCAHAILICCIVLWCNHMELQRG